MAGSQCGSGRQVRVAGCCVDVETGAYRGAKEGRLTTRERTLLKRLAASMGQPVRRDKLLMAFGYHPRARSRAVDKAMHSLRAKLEPDPNRPRHLVTVHGHGYVLHATQDRPSQAWGAPFVGRDTELAALDAALGPHSGVYAVVGPAGIGKTRLAHEWVARTVGRFDGGAVTLDLGNCRTDPEMREVMRHALGVALPDGDADTRLHTLLAQRAPTLWLADDADAVAGCLSRRLLTWLDTAPQHAWLVTSRVRLPLPVARHAQLGPLEIDAGVALFRAHVDADSGPQLRGLIDDLEGVPLAIELAATRCRVLTIAQLRDRMRVSLDVLIDRGRTSERQRSLRSCLARSWPLLSAPARRAVAALSVFAGGFCLPAAERVLADVGVGDGIDALQELVDVHLAERMEGRFRLRRAAQVYGAEQGGPELREHAEAAHGAWVRSLLGRLDPLERRTVPHSIRADLDNVVVARDRALHRGDADLAAAATVLATAISDLPGVDPCTHRDLDQGIGIGPGLAPKPA